MQIMLSSHGKHVRRTKFGARFKIHIFFFQIFLFKTRKQVKNSQTLHYFIYDIAIAINNKTNSFMFDLCGWNTRVVIVWNLAAAR